MPEHDKRVTLVWTVGGFFFIVVVGALLHFTYDWLGYSGFAALFSSVNESVWEHMKLGFFPLMLFTALEFWFIGRGNRSYHPAKVLGIIAMSLFIVAFFYTYTEFTGDDILILDIISFILGAALCQIIVYLVITYVVITRKWLSILVQSLGIAALVLIATLLVVFTFRTPRAAIFEDPNGHGYGTAWEVDAGALQDGHDH